MTGVIVCSMNRDEISKKFGAAFQNDFLFADTLRTNIAFGRDLTDEQILHGAENAQAMQSSTKSPADLTLSLR